MNRTQRAHIRKMRELQNMAKDARNERIKDGHYGCFVKEYAHAEKSIRGSLIDYKCRVTSKEVALT